ncbi:MAG TPA: sulfotransferase [Acidimicrobiia bacterium]|nr:sulfotransferase [Acidimicrobiia bacterium]
MTAPDGPHFVVGMPRAGTTFVVHRLNEHPEICAFGESRYWGNDWVRPDRAGRYDRPRLDRVRAKLVANPLDTNVGEDGPEIGRAGWMKTMGRPELAALVGSTLDSLDVPTDPGTVFSAYAGAIAAAEGKRIAVEKTPHHLRHVDRIRAHLPDARFVVMIRGPEGFLLSYKHFGDSKPERQRAVADARWHPIGVALLWRSYLRHALAVVGQLGDAALLVRNEELDADAPAVMERIQRFLGIEPVELVSPRPRRPSGRTTTSFAGARPELEPAESEWCRRVAGDEASAAGYELPRRSSGMAAMAREGATLVPWAVRNGLETRRRFGVPMVEYTRRALAARRGDPRAQG